MFTKNSFWTRVAMLGFIDIFTLNKKMPIFVLGCQRSGTTMLIKHLGKSSEISVYGEGDPRANKDHRFKDEQAIKRVIAKDRKQRIIFKPLNDIQYADRFLEFHKNAKAIWIYRNYNDVVNSAIIKWKDVQKNIIFWIAKHYGQPWDCNNKYDRDCAIYAEGMSKDAAQTLKQAVHSDMSNEDGAALLWFSRSKFYFDLGLDKNENVLLVKYEDIVENPTKFFKRIFDFIECRYDDNYAKGIRTTSIEKKQAPSLTNEIASICDDMTAKLNSAYAQQLADNKFV